MDVHEVHIYNNKPAKIFEKYVDVIEHLSPITQHGP